ncbi:hypothetical protein [Spirillospora sp. CA-294931]|uniref:hypothetical protein n=1 Tax=Spirillospora sp. CA-294931 TaxID=3240042 RepID=UPI003D909312
MVKQLNLAMTTALLGAAVVAAAPTPATAEAPATTQVDTYLGLRCGSKPHPCAWINLDRKHNRLRGYGSLGGSGGGKILVILQRSSPNGWREVSRSTIKGGNGYLRTGTDLEGCKRNHKYRTVLKWSRNGSPTRNFVSIPVNVGRC